MKSLRSIAALLAGALIFSSCVKKSFDNPTDPAHNDPALPVNAHAIDFVNAATSLGSGNSRLIGDSTISGIVIGDDHSGNLYKQIIIQDSASGLVIIMDRAFLYADYPVGRRVYIKLKGLYLVNYKGVAEIAYNVDVATGTTGIPSSLLSTYVIKGSYYNYVTPKTMSMATFVSGASSYVNTLVTLTDVEFDAASAGKTYALPSANTSRAVFGCVSGVLLGSAVVYTSSYANFQSVLTPTGKGTMTAIASIYNSSAQLLVRDTSDVHLDGARECP